MTPGIGGTIGTEMDVLTATEIVEQCKIPVAIATAVITVLMIPVKMVAMSALFTKTDKYWNPNRLAAKARHRQMIDRLKNHKV